MQIKRDFVTGSKIDSRTCHVAKPSLASLALACSLFAVSGTAAAQFSHCQEYPESSSCQGYGHDEGHSEGLQSYQVLEARWTLDFTSYVSQIVGARNRAPGNRPPVAGLDQRATGLAAGAGGERWNGWIAAAHSNMEHSFLRVDGNADVVLGGVDYTLNNDVIVGVATTIESSKTNSVGTKVKGDGYSIAPYVAIPLNANWLVDASIGIGRTDLDSYTGPLVAKANDDRTFGAVSLSYATNIGKWQMLGKASYLGSKDEFDTTPKTKSKLAQARVGGQVAYDAGNFVPYVGVTFIRDTTTPPGIVGSDNDRNATQLQAGVNIYSSGPLSGGISYSHEAYRKEIKNDILVANLSYRF